MIVAAPEAEKRGAADWRIMPAAVSQGEFCNGTPGKDPPRRRPGRAEGDLAGPAEDRARAAEEERAQARPRAGRAGLRQRGADLRGDLARSSTSPTST